MKRVWLVLLLIGMAQAAYAQQQGRPSYTPLPPTERNAQPNTPVVPWDKFCRQLVNHHPVSNVNIQPGQQCDVHGKPVVAATLPDGAALNMPKEYRMFITTAQARQLNIRMPNVPAMGNMLIGEVTVGADGTVRFDDQVIRPDRLYSVCERL